jgi:hypothetical protein
VKQNTTSNERSLQEPFLFENAAIKRSLIGSGWSRQTRLRRGAALAGEGEGEMSAKEKQKRGRGGRQVREEEKKNREKEKERARWQRTGGERLW